jgi:lysophospholipase L1-like esterase
VAGAVEIGPEGYGIPKMRACTLTMVLAEESRVARSAIFALLSLVLFAGFGACGEAANDPSSPISADAAAAGISSGGSGSLAGDGGAGGATAAGGANGSGGPVGAGGAAGVGGANSSAGSSGETQDAGVDGEPPTDAGTDGEAPPDAGLYNPCPPKGKPCVILPVGDSITAGSQSSTGGGYRLPLFHLANMNMKSLTFVGANMNGPATVDGVPFPRADSGYSGFEIDGYAGRQGIAQYFPAQITKYKPNIILLMIGTNDVASGVPNIPPRLATLMDTMLNADPSILLVVAQIVPQQKATPDTQNMLVQSFNSEIPGLVKARADAGKHVRLVDMYGALTKVASYSTLYFANTLHPNDAGYAVMADTWYAAIGPLLR